MRRSQQRSCSQTHTSSRNGLSEADQRKAEDLFQKYGYNAFLSDQLPLDRELPDTRDQRWVSAVYGHALKFNICLDAFIHLCRCIDRKYPHNLPTLSVVLIYLDEALSIIQRAICSIINRTPAHLLKEIILVDDHSTNGSFLSKPHPTLVSDAYCAQNELFILDVSLL